ncbi:MAG: agmatine deiminase family protein [Planctomycetota bacterium]|nr:agmatine deiminase family protein [Planctomycetota bacterium]
MSRASRNDDALYMPAEWKRHAATWMGWPHHNADWPGKFAAIPWVYGEIARHVTRGEDLRLLVENAAHEARARRVLEAARADLKRVRFHRWRTNRGWTRDFGPIFVRRGRRGKLAIAGFRFNAWARYSKYRKDLKIAARAARALRLRCLPVTLRGRHVVLEGGAIDVNGRGTLLTTEECLLDPRVQVRNPGFTRKDYEAVFERAFGVRNTIWLGHGIAGDDTHGHVDDLCRFVNRDTVVLIQEEHRRDRNYKALQENRERLQGARLENGSKLNVVHLPMPHPLYHGGVRLPASYANFYIANAAVLVPTFNDSNDREALGILGELFDRPVIGIHAVDLVLGYGTLHCLTQQQPREIREA